MALLSQRIKQAKKTTQRPTSILQQGLATSVSKPLSETVPVTLKRIEESKLAQAKLPEVQQPFAIPSYVPTPELQMPIDDGLTEERLLLARKESGYKQRLEDAKKANEERKLIAKEEQQRLVKERMSLSPDDPRHVELTKRINEATAIAQPGLVGFMGSIVPGSKELLSQAEEKATGERVLFPTAQQEKGYTAGAITGNIAQQAALYNTVGQALRASKLGQSILGKYGQAAGGQVVDILIDTAIQTPQEVIRGIKEDKSVGEQVKDFLINRTIDAALNLGIGAAMGEFKKAKQVVEVPEVQATLKAQGIEPDDLIKAIDNGDEAVINQVKEQLQVAPAVRQTDDIATTIKSIDEDVVKGPLSLSERLKSAQTSKGTPSIPEQGKIDLEPTTPIKQTTETTMAAVREDDLPSMVMKERGLSKNIRTDINRNDAVRATFDEKPEWYDVVSHKSTLESAQARFDKGYEEAIKDFDLAKGELRPDNVVLAKMIADEAGRRGDITTARRVIVDMAEQLTTAGQFSNAAKLLRDSNDPSAVLMFIQKEIKKLNTQGQKQMGRKWNEIDLLPDELALVERFTKDITDESKEQLFEQLFNSISKRIPTTKMEKFDSWRRMAMLFNPKTHIRNIVGNASMGGLKKISDTVETGLQKVLLKEADRTRVIKATPEAKKIAQDYFEANKKDLLSGGRWELFGVQSPFADKQIFNNKWLEAINNISKNTLEGEDAFFMQRHFINDLANTMTARGITEPTKEAVEYALRKAQQATFREANALADAINKLKGTKGWGKLVDGIVPFVKTPANIAKTGKDYSPIGLVEGVIGLITQANPQQAVETLSKGLTGSALMAVGAYAAKNGFVRGDYKRDRSEALSQLTGEMPNSIITPMGSYTIDWLQPTAIPFFMGVAMAEEFMNNENADIVSAGIEGLIAGGDSLFNQSLLSGIQDLLGGYGSTTEKIAEIPIDYLMQAFPTIGGQIARVLDPTKRQVDYNTDKISTSIEQLRSRTPGMTGDLPPKRDILGNVQTYGEKGVANVLNQLFNPGIWQKRTDDPVALELERVAKSEGYDFLPKIQTYSFNRNKKEYKLSGLEVSEFQRVQGEYAKERIANLMNREEYKQLPVSSQAKMLNDIFDEAYEQAKQHIVKMRGD